MEIPLSNREVLKVLKARKKYTKITKQFVEYLGDVVEENNVYPISKLRNIKGTDLTQEEMCIIENIQNLSIVKTNREIKKIKQELNK